METLKYVGELLLYVGIIVGILYFMIGGVEESE